MAVELARVPLTVLESTGMEMLDWIEFRARLFPGHRPRHDFEALTAYAKYRRSGGDSQPAGAKTPPVSIGTQERALVNGNNIVAPSSELSSWEGEGGTTLT